VHPGLDLLQTAREFDRPRIVPEVVPDAAADRRYGVRPEVRVVARPVVAYGSDQVLDGDLLEIFVVDSATAEAAGQRPGERKAGDDRFFEEVGAPLPAGGVRRPEKAF